MREQKKTYTGLRMDQELVGRRQTKQYEDERMARLAPRRRHSIPLTIFSWTFQILIVIMAAYLLVYFFGQRRTNVGSSMDPTLSGGDEVFINVLAYQMHGPAQGDIICFKPNGNTSSRSSIKRVIGTPGQTVQITDGMIYIDGKVYLENRSFPVMTNPGMAQEPILLGEGEYFVLGDNRNNSEDSRYAQVGLVRSDMIEGKVWFVFGPAQHRGFLRG